jgi:hypothetical protein
LITADKKPENIWLSVTAPLVLRTDLEGNMNNPRQIHFCDFNSAGKTWDANNRYCFWLRETLNVMKSDFKGYYEVLNSKLTSLRKVIFCHKDSKSQRIHKD